MDIVNRWLPFVYLGCLMGAGIVKIYGEIRGRRSTSAASTIYCSVNS
jgi:hypothetical protein